MRLKNYIQRVGIAFILVLFLGCNSSSKEKELTKKSVSSKIVATVVDTIPVQKPIIENNIYFRLKNKEELSFFFNRIKNTEIQNIFQREKGPYTILIPTNKALNEYAISNGIVIDSLTFNSGFFRNYILKGNLTSPKIVQGMNALQDQFSLKTARGELLTFYFNNDSLLVKNSNGNLALLIKTDVLAANGVIHIIDRVLATY